MVASCIMGTPDLSFLFLQKATSHVFFVLIIALHATIESVPYHIRNRVCYNKERDGILIETLFKILNPYGP